MRFQFTHPGGVRHQEEDDDNAIEQVSIHAPGRGATVLLRVATLGGGCFNSRTREGCDIAASSVAEAQTTFQFTHPGGVRLGSRAVFPTPSGFQFTHPGGVRPRPPRSLPSTNDSFNSRTREGCDLVPPTSQGYWCFNSRTREGCDSQSCIFSCNLVNVSIHAPGRGATFGISSISLLL